MPNRMMPVGGNAQVMAPRHPGAPNGMCEYALLLQKLQRGFFGATCKRGSTL